MNTADDPNPLHCQWCQQGIHSECSGPEGTLDATPCHCPCLDNVTPLGDGPCQWCDRQTGTEYCRCCGDVLCDECWTHAHVSVLS